MKALLLANGELYGPEILRQRLNSEEFDLVIGIDAGAKHAITLGLRPDALIGDFDSLEKPDGRGPDTPQCIAFTAEKNETDLELGVSYAMEKGADTVVIIGAMGGRMDMEISNVLLMAKTGFASCRLEIWHGEQTARVIRPPGGEITGLPGDAVSLIPLCSASGVNTNGLRYRLQNFEFDTGSSRGISNMMEEHLTKIELCQGLLLAVHSNCGLSRKGDSPWPERR
jgi:thiamine pyrophosphokinase